ncbi:hypothetical protein AXF42_Ash008055 [Apostasia shenzhenica]|uniref:Uncharacterized protein n=1 Tax=Apostasia shenzhenica TaxID=1088818 RepID=A0A2I0A8G2_9ASPA|nr:hypothetical protein AXF42_Ash008055 [Apostasia shenzhenica]
MGDQMGSFLSPANRRPSPSVAMAGARSVSILAASVLFPTRALSCFLKQPDMKEISYPSSEREKQRGMAVSRDGCSSTNRPSSNRPILRQRRLARLHRPYSKESFCRRHSSILFQVLNDLVNPSNPDIGVKVDYAAWKSADIKKALSEGRNPTLGPPSGCEDLLVPSML